MARDQQAWVRWLALPAELGWKRVKAHRAEPLRPGGRCDLTLFASVDGGRPHPRLQVSLPAATDPAPPGPLFEPDPSVDDAQSLRRHLERQLEAHRELLAAADLPDADAPEGSARFWRASIAGERRRRFMAEVRAWLRTHASDWSKKQRKRAQYAIAEAWDGLLVGRHDFDDADTGTYHSYGKDKPFVHVLKDLLDVVPEPGTSAFERLPPEQRAAVRAQRRQCQAHLDHLMRHKYAYNTVDEGDIERSVGGRLIDRKWRQVVTPQPVADALVPELALFRIEPDADHPHAGAWVYQDGETWRLRDGTEVDVPGDGLRRAPVQPRDVTFERDPDGPLLRQGVPFDWNRDGLIAEEPIGWIDWAGHCDLKAIQEMLGLTLTERPPPGLREHRTDTGHTHLFDRDALLEVLTALMEFGSVYQAFDGTGDVVKGVTRFGGARNDALPDRLQFKGPAPGKSFRWPLERRADALTVEAVSDPSGEAVELQTAFQRWLPDAEALRLEANPRYLTTVEGDYNVIDVSGHRLSWTGVLHGFDARSGAYQRRVQTFTVDLGLTAGRVLLGTHLQDAGARELYRVWLDADRPAIVAELERWERAGRTWKPSPVPERTVVLPMVSPLSVTLSREQKRDDPQAFQALLEAALRRGEGIVADTDQAAAVWNGVVTRLDVTREDLDRRTRTERWRVGIKARFGQASLRWLMRRDPAGSPEAYAAVADPRSQPADFLWQDFPDVGSKVRERGAWLVNKTMVDRGVVELRADATVDGGMYVHDEHIKNLAEILWSALAGHRYSIVHNNKRFVFDDEPSWKAAILEAGQRRDALDPGEPAT